MQMLDSTLPSSITPAGEPTPGLSGPRTAADVAGPEDVAGLRAELDRLLKQQRELMELLGTTRADRLLHDVRNLLQERIFLEAACRQMDP
jgi:hypothetical protein